MLVSDEPQQATAGVTPVPATFRSFWMGGFECATHINLFNERVDMIAGVQHDIQAEQDYALLQSAGMQTARDGIRWHLIEKSPGQYDWSSFEPMLKAALSQKVQVIWDLCHYGWPQDIDIFSPAFVDRFARFSGAVARFIADHTGEVPYYSPVNEISFFSWAATRNFMFPFAEGRDGELKRQLVRACIAATEAIWDVDRRARLTYPEPLINVVAPFGRPDLLPKANAYTESQFEAWDMIAGIAAPDLGGKPEYLDIIGANFYASNQWETTSIRLNWEQEPPDVRWRPLHTLLGDVWRRYQRPIYLAETSHIGHGRAKWIRQIAREVYLGRQQGTPVDGICLYPILDRYDWQDRNHWHNSGLWDLSRDQKGCFHRVINADYLSGLTSARTLLSTVGCV